MEGVEWDTLDMHDALPLTGHHSLPDWLGTDQPTERKQCVLLSAVAAALWAKGGQPPEREVVWAEALQARWEMLQQALHAQEALGDTPKHMPQGEADLRVYIHAPAALDLLF